MLLVLAVALALVGPPAPAATAEFARTTHCDLPFAKNLGSPLRFTEIDACETACAAEAPCRSYVFVSGWNRCFLKGEPGKTATIRFFSGRVTGGRVHDADFDRDDSGGDLRRVTHIRSGELCGQECVAEPLCRAFAHIAGYDDCWLKLAAGTQHPKIFSCGIRNAAAAEAGK